MRLRIAIVYKSVAVQMEIAARTEPADEGKDLVNAHFITLRG